MALFGSDGYVRPPYRHRRAAHFRVLAVSCIAVLASLVVFLALFLLRHAMDTPLPDVNAWNLRIVSLDTPVSDDFSVTTAALPRDFYLSDVQEDVPRFDTRAYDALCAMLAAAQEKGYRPIVTRAYCDVQTQRTLFKQEQRRLRQEEELGAQAAYERAMQTHGDPNASEYALGLCADIFEKGQPQSTSVDFSQTALYQWLVKNAAYYGFILRYPEPCTQQTGHAFDAHCFRYVGRPAAQHIARKQMCLEGYVQMLLSQAEKRAQKGS